ncbi:MAG: cysteine--tRNA ligase [Candidatus Beckwithbacteria bacterium]|nr:cysteine--tRNA ligase [Patescibacteria group bacterium]
MKLFNTLTRKIEEFRLVDRVRQAHRKQVGVYICGPTVYDYAHIGHARAYINSDCLVRALRWLDYKVKVVMNVTDVGHLTSDADSGEDKMEKKAREENKNIWKLADYYSKDFFEMLDQLNIVKPDVVARVTDHISEQIDLIKKLEKKGFTYKTSDGIYFDSSKFKDYGKLARLDIEGLKEGVRVKKNLEKKNATDFALWKFSYPDSAVRRLMEWESPWGVGFPGWHIECSAISMKYLGETIDIHTGGIDHIPVHHTNEIAQSEACTGKKFVNYWFHSNFLDIDGEKMSKSLKNFIRVKDLEIRGYEPRILRYLFLTGHYRTKMNFTYKSLDAAKEAYKKLTSISRSWSGTKGRTKLSPEKLEKLQGVSLKFRQAVENDLNMPQAMAVVWEMAKSNIPEYDKWELILDWDQVLGLGLGEVEKDKVKISVEVETLVKKRESLRKEKKWDEADVVRLEIEKKGYLIEDKEEGKTHIRCV